MLWIIKKFKKEKIGPSYSKEGQAIFDLLQRKDEWSIGKYIGGYICASLEHKNGLNLQSVSSGFYVQVSSQENKWTASIFTAKDHERLYAETNKLYTRLFNKPICDLIFDSLNKSSS